MPLSGVSKPSSIRSMVDFPLPDEPTSATNSPGLIEIFTLSSTSGVSFLYRKLTFESSILPFNSPTEALVSSNSGTVSSMGLVRS
ncbi:MAG: hypothetical protein ACD_47C00343G0002 [uncultured bacterium]|nr:MAG: hypothetical protein ACD_47C00343G0002 [uncultured bacterium]